MNIKVGKGGIKHGRAVLEAGKTYEVPEGLGWYFTSMGWAEQTNAQGEKLDPALFQFDAPERKEGDLQVDKATLGQRSENRG